MNLWKEVDKNKRMSALFVTAFIVFVIAIGWLFSYVYNSPVILVIAVLIALVQAYSSYYLGDSIVLSMSGAEQIEKKDSPVLWNVVENLTITAGLPMPKVYIIPDSSPNAFATGRDPDHASIAVTNGLLQMMDKSELEGVVAHEMSHIGNYDIRLSMIIAILVSVIALLSDLFIRSQWLGLGRRRDSEGGGVIVLIGILAAVLSPIVAVIIQLAVSRKREFLADADGALLTRYPDGLASALSKIAKVKQPLEHVSTATAHLFIASPLGNGEDEENQSFWLKLFSTHPPLSERIKILRGMNLK
ncbi:MAG: M48 family metalloprotease [Candidatus Berkelbacteria bacterium]|nr:M48 family metalloprotease [Candidatus Berkelbacteria bacterium]